MLNPASMRNAPLGAVNDLQQIAGPSSRPDD